MAIQYPVIKKGRFVSRPNRFVIFMEMDGKIVKAHMPNPGRMRELLFPGSRFTRHPMPKKVAARSTASLVSTGKANRCRLILPVRMTPRSGL